MPPLTPPVIPAGRFAESAQPVLNASGGLTLRPWTLEDAPVLVTAYSDPVVQHWHGLRLVSVDEPVELIKRWQDGWTAETSAHWAVCSGDEVVGRMALREMNLRWGGAEVAYWTLPAARGAGTAPRALSAMASWAFGDAGFHRLWLKHSVKNQPSCRVAVKADFDAEGTERSSELHADGWHDMHVHARVNE